jgi:hypothetical protein
LAPPFLFWERNNVLDYRFNPVVATHHHSLGITVMPTYFEKHTYNVAGAYLPAIINGDYTGMDYGDDAEAEVALVDRFVAGFPAGTVFDCNDEPRFTTCDICKLKADCYTLTAWCPNADYTQAIADYCARTDADFAAVCAFVDAFGLDELERFEDAYEGTFAYQSDIDSYLCDLWLECNAAEGLSDSALGYLDYDKIARDMRYDYVTEESGDRIYLFRNY